MTKEDADFLAQQAEFCQRLYAICHDTEDQRIRKSVYNVLRCMLSLPACYSQRAKAMYNCLDGYLTHG